MVWAIIKLSYNNIWDSTLTGGVCWTWFIISKDSVLTAYHVLNKNTFLPNKWYKFCEVFFCIEPDIIIKVEKKVLNFYPSVDTTQFNINSKVSIPQYWINKKTIGDNESVLNIGFIWWEMPQFQEIKWWEEWIHFWWITFNNIAAYWKWNIIKKTFSIKSNDVNIDNIHWYLTSYPWVEGMSWWPLIQESTNKIIWLMSFGFPMDVSEKTNLWAININEILKIIES